MRNVSLTSFNMPVQVIRGGKAGSHGIAVYPLVRIFIVYTPAMSMCNDCFAFHCLCPFVFNPGFLAIARTPRWLWGDHNSEHCRVLELGSCLRRSMCDSGLLDAQACINHAYAKALNSVGIQCLCECTAGFPPMPKL